MKQKQTMNEAFEELRAACRECRRAWVKGVAKFYAILYVTVGRIERRMKWK